MRCPSLRAYAETRIDLDGWARDPIHRGLHGAGVKSDSTRGRDGSQTASPSTADENAQKKQDYYKRRHWRCSCCCCSCMTKSWQFRFIFPGLTPDDKKSASQTKSGGKLKPNANCKTNSVTLAPGAFVDSSLSQKKKVLPTTQLPQHSRR